MRTRFLNKMTGREVGEYLKRNDIIFVPFGVVETHGRFPLDIETTIPEAACKLMAERVDGLVLGGLTYFFCGATTESRGTVQMSVSDGYDYLKAIAYALLKQGFRRMIFVGGHGPAYLSGKMLALDFYKETGVPVTYMDCPLFGTPEEAPEPFEMHEVNQFVMTPEMTKGFNALSLGAYEILDRLDEIIINPDVEPQHAYDGDYMIDDHIENFNYVIQCGPLSGQVGFYHSHPENHMGYYGEMRSREELERVAKEGAEMIRANIAAMDLEGYVQAMRNIDLKTQRG